jgi:hypothetical protein
MRVVSGHSRISREFPAWRFSRLPPAPMRGGGSFGRIDKEPRHE